MPTLDDRAALAAALSKGGFVAADEEAELLLASAGGDRKLLELLLGRRLGGEPLAWIVGRVSFCGLELRVAPGVYVPRPQTELIVRRAIARLPADGVAIDLCTGTGAIAAVLAAHHSGARIVASDLDQGAVACARDNGVEAYLGDLLAPLPEQLEGGVDVIVCVAPYVPTPELPLLQRDTLEFESPLSYDGGRDGADLLRRALEEGSRWLRPGGTILLELGGDQAELLSSDLARLGYSEAVIVLDEEDDPRGIEATFAAGATRTS